MTLERAELWQVTLPLRSAVHWTAGGAEEGAPYLVLILHDRDGGQGAAEITCRPAWNGMTPALLAKAFEELAWPRLTALSAHQTLAEALSGIREMTALKALCDNAWRDLTAPMTGGSPVRAASVLTHAAPQEMAQSALRVAQETGIDAFKIKLGQGIAQDAAVLRALREALPDAELSGDANSAYGQSDVADLAALTQEFGLAFLEDPWPMTPGKALRAAASAVSVPLLSDRAVTGAAHVGAFADHGVLQVSAKPSRLGATTALAVAAAAKVRGGRICNGTYAESALGAAAQIGFASSLPPGLAHPHEVDFHRGLAEQIAPVPVISDGHAHPASGRLAEILDRDALRRLGTAGPLLRS